MSDVARSRRTWGAGTVVLLAALILLALSLRSGISSLSVLLPTVRDELAISPAGVSLLTTLPPLCFAVVGLGTGRLVLRYGVHRITVALLAALVVGLVGRALADTWWIFGIGTMVAMAGAAVGNVVLPPLTKLHFARHEAGVSAVYGAALVGGATLASALTVPIADATDGWRVALATWAVLPALALLGWLPTLRTPETGSVPADAPTGASTPEGTSGSASAGAAAPPTLGRIVRTPLGWAFIICFGAQSAQAYVQFGWWGLMLTDLGADAAHAGVLLGIITAVGIPVTLSLPLLIRVTRDSAALPLAFSVSTVIGWLGVLLAPLALGGVLWAVLLGFGAGAFTWVLAMLARRSRSPEGSSQLSALTQGVGYFIAAAATFATGLLHDATGDWQVGIVMMLALAVVIGVAGAAIARGGTVEDAVAAHLDARP
ncbi:MFS transporter [Nocardioides sambongensis]|uniref:MFS transporter n=1 Tax=Nocardioides sambongensis TaxID=2589074 RepID=UPI00112CB9F0|nr:MFS transporter [Nocardioides sambongensis]